MWSTSAQGESSSSVCENPRKSKRFAQLWVISIMIRTCQHLSTMPVDKSRQVGCVDTDHSLSRPRVVHSGHGVRPVVTRAAVSKIRLESPVIQNPETPNRPAGFLSAGTSRIMCGFSKIGSAVSTAAVTAGSVASANIESTKSAGVERGASSDAIPVEGFDAPTTSVRQYERSP